MQVDRRIKSELQDSLLYMDYSPGVKSESLSSSLNEIVSEEVNSTEKMQHILNLNLIFWRFVGFNIIVWLLSRKVCPSGESVFKS